MNLQNTKVLVIGAGLAGSEASFFLAEKGVKVVLIEKKTLEKNPAQKSVNFAELVCTNSLKSLKEDSAHGLLKIEMNAFNSLILNAASKHAVPAGDALAVDRENFSNEVTNVLKSHPNIQIIEMDADDPNKLMQELECNYCIVATGPLTSKKLEDWIMNDVSGDDFYFYDAIAPVVDADTLDYSKLYYKDRWKDEEESADYLNAPFDKEEYYNFINELKNSERVPSKDFEDFKFFESCLPIDTMADRGDDTPRFSCMKPKGLMMKNGKVPYAVVQLRKENLLGSAFNLVGFQTRLTYKEQVRVFRMIPGFENASFLHLGSIHRNSFLNAKKLLDFDLSSKKYPNIYFAGQITGVEGYTESASMGIYTAFQIMRKIENKEPIAFPVETAMGALVNYIMTAVKPVPSSINFGLIPPVPLAKGEKRSKESKKNKKLFASKRGQEVFNDFINTLN